MSGDHEVESKNSPDTSFMKSTLGSSELPSYLRTLGERTLYLVVDGTQPRIFIIS